MRIFPPLLLSFICPIALLGHHETSKIRNERENGSFEVTTPSGSESSFSGNFFNVTTQGSDSVDELDSLDFYIPVELISFKAKPNGKQVKIHWVTASELNAQEFELYHGTDGKTWRSIARLRAAGNSQSVRNYTFRHEHPVHGLNYYNLIQRDFDGQERLNEMIVFELDDNNTFFSIQPNPVSTEHLMVRTLQNSQLTIGDISGKLLETIQLQEGNNVVSVGHLPPGTYWFNLGDVRSNSEQFKIIKQ